MFFILFFSKFVAGRFYFFVNFFMVNGLIFLFPFRKNEPAVLAGSSFYFYRFLTSRGILSWLSPVLSGKQSFQPRNIILARPLTSFTRKAGAAFFSAAFAV